MHDDGFVQDCSNSCVLAVELLQSCPEPSTCNHFTKNAQVLVVPDHIYPDSKVQGANMGPTWVLSAPDGPHVGPMNLAIWVVLSRPIN